MRVFSLSVVLLSLCCGFGAGCSSGEGEAAGGVARACAPGRVEVCPCVGGGQGVQVCAEDGARWAACVCPGADMSAADMPHVGDMVQASDMSEDMPEDMSAADMGLVFGPDGCVLASEGAARESGRALYVQHCAACHGQGGRGSVAGPGILGDVAEEEDRELIEVMMGGEDDMPPIGVTYGEGLEIVGYLVSLADGAGYSTQRRCRD